MARRLKHMKIRCSNKSTFAHTMVALLVVTSLHAFTACSSIGVSDGSLDYREKQLLKPLDMAGESATVIQPALHLPEYQTAQKGMFENEKGNRFVMPRPTPELATDKVQQTPKSSNRVPTALLAQSKAPKALTENEQGVPILQVQTDIKTTVNAVEDVLQGSGFKVVKPLTGNYLIITNPAVFDGERLLRMRNAATVTSVMVTNTNNTLADVGEARYILNAIYAGI